jgi:hypothetical protein
LRRIAITGIPHIATARTAIMTTAMTMTGATTMTGTMATDDPKPAR